MEMRIPAKGEYSYHVNVGLEQKCRRLEKENAALRSGEALEKERARAEKWRRSCEREERDALEAAKDAERKVRLWQQAAGDCEAEAAAANERADRAEAELRKAKATIREQAERIRELGEVVAALQEKPGLNHTNSGIPSSRDPIGGAGRSRHNRNSRKGTGRRRGAQEGHGHHPRPWPDPTEPPVVHADRPEWLTGDDWELTEEFVERRVVPLVVRALVTPHHIMYWRNRRTGGVVPSRCPEGLSDELTYDAGVKAFAGMPRLYGNMAVRRVQTLLREVTGGAVNLSTGAIPERAHELAVKGSGEIQEIFRTPYVHVDTSVTMNDGRREAVTIVVDGDGNAFFSHTRRKGSEAVDPPPCPPGMGYKGDVVSDREPAFQNIGTDHQDCLEHHKRDCQRVADMEKDKTWASHMADLFRTIIVEQGEWDDGGPTEERKAEFLAQFDKIVELGQLQYGRKPASEHWKFGERLLGTLKGRRKQLFLCLDKPWIPATNNAAERCAKAHKRSLHAATTFRSDRDVDDSCAGLTLTRTAIAQDRPIYPMLLEIYGRSGPTRAH